MPRAAAPDPRPVRGVVAFNAGAFYEAHELWEELWNDTAAPRLRVVPPRRDGAAR
jgi:hypothetical protein